MPLSEQKANGLRDHSFGVNVPTNECTRRADTLTGKHDLLYGFSLWQLPGQSNEMPLLPTGTCYAQTVKTSGVLCAEATDEDINADDSDVQSTIR